MLIGPLVIGISEADLDKAHVYSNALVASAQNPAASEVDRREGTHVAPKVKLLPGKDAGSRYPLAGGGAARLRLHRAYMFAFVPPKGTVREDSAQG